MNKAQELSESQPLLSPKKPDGTTDWDVVFDDPDRGLISLIDRVNSSDSLEQCGQIMIKRLFTRKNDQPNVDRFNRELDKIMSFAGAVGNLSEIKAEVVVMLQSIKSIRVAKAAEYLKEKAEKQSENRRSTNLEEEGNKSPDKIPNLIPIVVSGSLILGVLLVAFIIWLTQHNPSADIAEQKQPDETLSELAAKQKGIAARKQNKAIQREVERKLALLEKSAAETNPDLRKMPLAIVLPTVTVQLPGQKTRSGKLNQVMAILVLDNRDYISDVCAVRPKLVDIVNIALSKGASGLSTGTPLDYKTIAGSVRQQINRQVRGDPVIHVKLVAGNEIAYQTSTGRRCNVASDKYLDYFYPPEN